MAAGSSQAVTAGLGPGITPGTGPARAPPPRTRQHAAAPVPGHADSTQITAICASETVIAKDPIAV